MSDCELIPVTLNDLDIVSELTVKFDFPRSVGWIKRALFNPHVAPCDENARRGYVLKSREDGYVGVLCYSPMKLYLKQRPIIGYSGLLLGVQKKYGEWLMDLFKAVQEDEKGHLAFGNTSCSAHATRICRMARGDKLGPDECCCSRSCELGLTRLLVDKFLKKRSYRCKDFAWRMLLPMRKIEQLFRYMSMRSIYTFSQESSFNKNDFSNFWNSYLKGNKGLVSSREPEILEHLFGDSLRAKKLVLLTARKGGSVIGYVLLRKYRLHGLQNALKYKIIDAVALCNNVKCLCELIRYAKVYACGHSGAKVEYIGGNPFLEDWIDVELPVKTNFGYNTTTWFYSGCDQDLIDAVQNRNGWFFGPYDGERCLGHAGYIDL